MTDSVFDDTNVLVYRHDATEPDKQHRCQLWLEKLWREEQGRLSVQVLNELYSTLTQKLTPGLPQDAARDVVRPYFAWRPLALSSPVIEDAWTLERDASLSWWDALIVAAANRSGSRWLLSEDLADGMKIGSVRIVDPFRTEPDQLADR